MARREVTQLDRVQQDLSLLRILVKSLLAEVLTPEAQLEAASVAAEMLVHFGRGQRAAEQGTAFGTADAGTLAGGTEIFVRGTNPELVERMFTVFMNSVATAKMKGVFNGDSAVRQRVCAYSFLLGNLSWHAKPGPAMDLATLQSQFDLIKAECPDPATAGGGEFCHMGPF